MRYLATELDDAPQHSGEVVVVGSGVAGLRSALSLSNDFSITLITKQSLKDSNTNWAQGGIASVLSDDDSFESHYQDTLKAGDGLCDENRVKELVHDGPTEVKQLMKWGANFDTEDDGSLSFGREGGHSRSRIVHGRGDATGSLVEDTLVEQVRKNPKITVYENSMMVDIISDSERGYGLVLLQSEEFKLLWFRGLILATGGLGQLFRETTNHEVVTGDGMAAGYRAGLPLQDMEFIQFHPTTLYVAGGPRFLISEAVRGAGAKLVNNNGDRFMDDIHSMAELAPRDIVSRAILRQMIETESECVYLDATDLTEERVEDEFPTISETCKEYGINPAVDRIPVRPCAHYSMGGIRSTLSGRTDLDNVFVAGEVACTGIHGANRLASNSLLEGMVMGKRIIEELSKGDLPPLQQREPQVNRQPKKRRLNIKDLKRSLQSLMWRHAGILRDKDGLKKAHDQISDWISLFERHRITTRDEVELANLLTLGKCVVSVAMKRKESRGAHFFKNFPEKKEKFRKHSLTEFSGQDITYAQCN